MSNRPGCLATFALNRPTLGHRRLGETPDVPDIGDRVRGTHFSLLFTLDYLHPITLQSSIFRLSI